MEFDINVAIYRIHHKYSNFSSNIAGVMAGWHNNECYMASLPH